MSMYAVSFKGLKNPVIVRADGSQKAITKAQKQLKSNRQFLSVRKLSGVEIRLME